MWEFFKPMRMVDWLMIVVAIALFATMDYSNLSIIDEAYFVCVGLWIILLGSRLYEEHKKRNS